MIEKIKELNEKLREGIVTFEYTKKDGTTRTAKGTLKESYLPDIEPEEFMLTKEGVDSVIKEKNYDGIEDYMNENKIELVRESEDGISYVFRHKKRKVVKNESTFSYYDIEKESFRSFTKENFLRIISVE